MSGGGAGTSGLTIAKYAKKAYPKFDVVNVEMIVWIDDTLGIEVVGVASGKRGSRSNDRMRRAAQGMVKENDILEGERR